MILQSSMHLSSSRVACTAREVSACPRASIAACGSSRPTCGSTMENYARFRPVSSAKKRIFRKTLTVLILFVKPPVSPLILFWLSCCQEIPISSVHGSRRSIGKWPRGQTSRFLPFMPKVLFGDLKLVAGTKGPQIGPLCHRPIVNTRRLAKQ